MIIFSDAQIRVTSEKPWIGMVIYKGHIYQTRPRRTKGQAQREAEKLTLSLGAKYERNT